MAGLVGVCGELTFTGGTAIYDPQGRCVAAVESGTGMVIVDLDLAAVAEARAINPYDVDRPASLGGHMVTRVEVVSTSSTTGGPGY